MKIKAFLHHVFVNKHKCRKYNITIGKNTSLSKGIKGSGACRVTIGDNCKIGDGVMFWGNGDIKVGNNVTIRNHTWIHATKERGGVTIGDNCLIAPFSFIIDSNHGIQKDVLIKDQQSSCEPIKIGNDVWIGTHSTILKGTVLKDGCVVGAGCTVKGVYEENSVLGTSLAKVIKERK